MAAAIVLAFWLFVVFSICSMVLKWNDMRYRRKGLPPGTMGWPLFGETLEFIKYGPDFMKKQKTRYGSFFKTHILGCPAVISMDPELNRYILLNEAKGLVPGYPKSMLDIMGNCNIGAVHGSTHKYMRGSLVSLIGPATIRDHLLPKIDSSIRCFLANWAGKTIDIQERTTEMAFLIAFEQVFEIESSGIYHKFKKEFDKMAAGSLSLPINIPGTSYHYGLQGRKRVCKMLSQIMKKRRASSTSQNDILGHLLGYGDLKHHLKDEEIIDQIYAVLYSGYETVSTTTMMAIKYLHDHPKALHQLREEHLAIRRRKNGEDPIDWEDYKSMSFTRAVINETLRLATVINGVLRKTTKDIELEGFIVPKGWRIYVFTREINYDEVLYPEPFTFNPWRWLDKDLESNKYYCLFGAGTRLCPGKEMGIVKVSLFLHYFVTQYRWEEAGGELKKFPRVEAPNGLHIRVSKLSE